MNKYTVTFWVSELDPVEVTVDAENEAAAHTRAIAKLLDVEYSVSSEVGNG